MFVATFPIAYVVLAVYLVLVIAAAFPLRRLSPVPLAIWSVVYAVLTITASLSIQAAGAGRGAFGEPWTYAGTVLLTVSVLLAGPMLGAAWLELRQAARAEMDASARPGHRVD